MRKKTAATPTQAAQSEAALLEQAWRDFQDEANNRLRELQRPDRQRRRLLVLAVVLAVIIGAAIGIGATFAYCTQQQSCGAAPPAASGNTGSVDRPTSSAMQTAEPTISTHDPVGGVGGQKDADTIIPESPTPSATDTTTASPILTSPPTEPPPPQRFAALRSQNGGVPLYITPKGVLIINMNLDAGQRFLFCGEDENGGKPRIQIALVENELPRSLRDGKLQTAFNDFVVDTSVSADEKQIFDGMKQVFTQASLPAEAYTCQRPLGWVPKEPGGTRLFDVDPKPNP